MATKKDTAAKAEEVKEVKEEAAAEAPAIDYHERVKIKLPRVPGKGDSLYVAINDYSALIKRGEYVYVPLYVALHLQECQDQEEKAEMLIESLRNEN